MAIRDQLRLPVLSGGLNFSQYQCEVGLDGKPNTLGGQWYVAVHGGRENNSHLTCMEDDFTCYVTLSMQCSVPFDRIGPDQLELLATGFDPRMDAIRACIMKNQWAIMALANTTLGASVNGFIEALFVGPQEEPSAQGDSWFSTAPQQKKTMAGVLPFVGFKATLTLPGAKRIQYIENASP